MENFLRWFRWIGIPTVGVLFFISLLIAYPYDEHGENFILQNQKGEVLASLVFGTLFSLLVFESGVWLSGLLDRRLSWARHPVRRVLLQIGLLTLLAEAVTVAFGWAYVYFAGIEQEAPVRWTDLLPLELLALFTALLLSAVYIGASFFTSWRAEAVAREQAVAQATEAQLRALQQQLDPHFLFNTLNTLTAVIEDDPPRAVTYVQRLATVYRYVLHHRPAEKVRLQDELHLATAYLYLLETRYQQALQLSIEVDAPARQRYVLPMVLQLLIENAVKHNRLEADAPLHLRIYSAGRQLVVENTVCPLGSAVPSGRVGLLNIRNRYRVVAGHDIAVEHTPDWFRVTLPLLDK